MGPWQVIARGTFPDLIPQVGTWSPVKVNLTVNPVDPPVKGRFVKYECATMYGDACALHYVGVVQQRNVQQDTPDPQGMFDLGGLFDDIGLEMATAALLLSFPFLSSATSRVVNFCM